jgi:hypothetical protein
LEHRYHIPRLSGAELRPQYTKSSMISGTTLHTSISRSHMNFGKSLWGVMLWAQRRRAALRTRRVWGRSTIMHECEKQHLTKDKYASWLIASSMN